LKNLLSIAFFLSSFLGLSQGLTVEIPMEYANEEAPRFLAKDSLGYLKVVTDRGIHSHYGTSSAFFQTEATPTILLPDAWLGTENGTLYRLAGKDNQPVPIADSSAISCLLELDRKIFIGT
jgi:hypothetical protein